MINAPTGYCFLEWVGSTEVEVTSGAATFTTDADIATVHLTSFVDAQTLAKLLNSSCAKAFDNGVQTIKYRVAKP
jgi:hypothetical protein